MKIKYLLFASLLVLSGCTQSAQPTNADNGKIEAQGIDRVLTASDVHISNQYQFAVNQTAIEGIDTYSAPVSISTADQTNLTIYGSDMPIADFEADQPVGNSTLIGQVISDGETESIYTFTEGEQYQYYQIIASEECDIVVSVA